MKFGSLILAASLLIIGCQSEETKTVPKGTKVVTTIIENGSIEFEIPSEETPQTKLVLTTVCSSQNLGAADTTYQLFYQAEEIDAVRQENIDKYGQTHFYEMYEFSNRRKFIRKMHFDVSTPVEELYGGDS